MQLNWGVSSCKHSVNPSSLLYRRHPAGILPAGSRRYDGVRHPDHACVALRSVVDPNLPWVLRGEISGLTNTGKGTLEIGQVRQIDVGITIKIECAQTHARTFGHSRAR